MFSLQLADFFLTGTKRTIAKIIDFRGIKKNFEKYCTILLYNCLEKIIRAGDIMRIRFYNGSSKSYNMENVYSI